MDNLILEMLEDKTGQSVDREESDARIRANLAHLEYADLRHEPIAEDVLTLLPLHNAEHFRITPFFRSGRVLKVASVSTPSGPTKTRLVQLGQQTGYEIQVVIVSPTSLNSVLNQYAKLIKEKSPQVEKINKPKEKIDLLNSTKTTKDVAGLAQQSDIVDLLDILIAGAINAKASDIHIEPRAADFVVRYRLDGILYDIVTLALTKFHPLDSRIKILAGLNLDNDQSPQDGGFEKQYHNILVHLRVSILPTNNGEAITMRVARSDQTFIPLEELGFSDHDRQRIQAAAAKSQGLIIASGPTGSGKTTTLYAILNSIKTAEKKIITIEDPIEYNLPGVEQSQINRAEKYSFATALRSVLRQDPNIIMVGEIRDSETASTAFDAAMTGHLVLTTMHAPSTVLTFARLLDLGVKTNLLSGSINCIINQRLVRRLCPDCKGKKCIQCNNLAYKGRIVLAETLVPSAELERAVIARKDNETILNLAKQNGLKTIAEDGQEKVSSGITDAEEVARVVQ